MLTVTRRGIFSTDLDVRDGISPVASISMSSFRERAEIRLGAQLYEARRVGWIPGAFVLVRQDMEVARAEMEGFFRRSLRVFANRSTLAFKPRGFMRTEYALFDGATEIGWIRRAGFWRSTIEASFTPELDRAVQMFLVWIAAVLWRRAATAAAAG